MKILNKIVMGVMVLFSLTSCEAQIKNSKTETVKVYGNCGMCKKTIETAANKKGLVKADWNVETKMLTMTYNAKKTSQEAILKKVADAGYDSDTFSAPDKIYSALHGCCQYERPSKTSKGNYPE